MIPATHIKRTIDFNNNFRSLLEVLKLVAVSQYHALEQKLKKFEALEKALSDFLGEVDIRQVRHPFLDPGDRPSAVVAVTSDAGLLGGLNMQVVTHAVDLIREHRGHLVVVGERGQACAQDMKLPFDYFPGIVDARRYEQAAQLRDHLTHQVIHGGAGAVKIVYPRAISLVLHRIETESLLPYARSSGQAPETPEDCVYESDPREVFEYLMHLFLGQRLYEIFGMSRLAEQAARFVHLEESSEKISDMNGKLLLQYFRRRHEVIDQNMRELFASRSLYAK